MHVTSVSDGSSFLVTATNTPSESSTLGVVLGATLVITRLISDSSFKRELPEILGTTTNGNQSSY